MLGMHVLLLAFTVYNLYYLVFGPFASSKRQKEKFSLFIKNTACGFLYMNYNVVGLKIVKYYYS